MLVKIPSSPIRQESNIGARTVSPPSTYRSPPPFSPASACTAVCATGFALVPGSLASWAKSRYKEIIAAFRLRGRASELHSRPR